MGPALSSGMLQINVFTDLFFASGIVERAGLLRPICWWQTVGPALERAAGPLLPCCPAHGSADRRPVVGRISPGLMLSTPEHVPLALDGGAGAPIVALVYERGLRQPGLRLVGGLLMAYGLGDRPIGGDVLVRGVPMLGDG